MNVGIVGAGKLGSALARRSLNAGHEVLVATRPGSVQSTLVVEVMAPGAVAAPVHRWGWVDLAVLAVPFHIALTIDLPLPERTVVIDPTNHWEPVDGPLAEFGRQPVGVECRVALLLPAIGRDRLREVARLVEQPDADERNPEVGCRLQVISREDAEAARVLGQRGGDAELR